MLPWKRVIFFIRDMQRSVQLYMVHIHSVLIRALVYDTILHTENYMHETSITLNLSSNWRSYKLRLRMWVRG